MRKEISYTSFFKRLLFLAFITLIVSESLDHIAQPYDNTLYTGKSRTKSHCYLYF